MNMLGNLIWLIFGGIVVAIEYIVASILLMLTIVGIPFGTQTLKLGMLALWPFGSTTVSHPGSSGCLSTLMNILWIFFGGIWIALTHLLFGVLLAITIIGIPFARQHFKLATLALTPFGREIVPVR
ncbi:MAG: YccF domain-containing protein [Bacteroidales bacterium]|nr:YccF domain-containing protein [Bacteroidales bacterium]